MDTSSLLIFATAYLAILAVPGPGVTALVARVLARGTQGAPAFIAGIVAGALIWFTLAATGLAVVAQLFAGVFVAIRYAGAAWLLYLAWKLWHAPARSLAPPPADSGRMFLTGLALNLGNPKAILFFLALLPNVVDLRELTLLGFLELAALIVLIAGGVLSAYALAASRARGLFGSATALRRMNRTGAVAMAGAAVSIAAR